MKLTTEQLLLLSSLALLLGLTSFKKSHLNWLFKLKFRKSHSSKEADIFLVGEFISDDDRVRQTHIVGATGSGKTILLESLLFKDLARGNGALVIDAKGDREFYERVKKFCGSIGRSKDLHYLSASFPKESVVWNPCGLGNASELQSKFFNSSIYSEPHYAKACELGLLLAFNDLTASSSNRLSLIELVQKLKEIKDLEKSKELEGLFLDLYNLTLSEWAKVLGCRSQSESKKEFKKELSILELTRKNDILFVDLPTENKAVQSARVGRLLLQELLLISGLRKLYPHIKSDKHFSVFIDEFDAFATPSFATFLNKGRSSGFMIHMCHQTLSDLKKISSSFMGQVLGNCNVRFIFRQDDPDDAETWARFFGTKKIVKQTYQTENHTQTGKASNREAQEFRISPDLIKELKTGQCVFSVKTKATLKIIEIPFEKTIKILTQPSQRELGFEHIEELVTPDEVAGKKLSSVNKGFAPKNLNKLESDFEFLLIEKNKKGGNENEDEKNV